MKALHLFQLKQSCPRFNSLVACLSQLNRSVWLGQDTSDDDKAKARGEPARPELNCPAQPATKVASLGVTYVLWSWFQDRAIRRWRYKKLGYAVTARSV